MIDFSQLPLTLGDYQLRELLSDDGSILTFVAEQSLIHRDVILAIINPEKTNDQLIASFLESARAKAKVKEGRICSVFEATHNDGMTFYTQELPGGEHLDKLAAEKVAFTPVQIARILKELAITQIYYEQHALKVSPWHPSSIFLDKNGETRFLNLVEAGDRSEAETRRDQDAVGQFFPTLVKTGEPGATRVLTLCSWMAGGPDAPRGMNWSMVQELCQTIIDQLGSDELSTTSPYFRSKKKTRLIKKLAVAGILLLAVGIAVVQYPWKARQIKDAPPVVKKLDLPSDVLRPDAEIRFYDKEANLTKTLSVDVHEVTIGAYGKFLEFISGLTSTQLGLFRNPDEPSEKNSYIPRDWLAMLTAANTEGTWNGHKITRNSPVVNIDYWDALAYAKWEGRRLPTRSEWKSLAGDDKTPKPQADPYCSVSEYQNDISATGLGGLAGGVAEWTSTQSVNLAMPMSGKKPVVCGGSYQNKGDFHTEDYMDSENSFREDLGFRTVKDIKQP